MPRATPGPKPPTPRVVLRDEVAAGDAEIVRCLTRATGFFRPDETDVAVELVESRLAQGPRSGYDFLFAESRGSVVAYACFGPIACSLGSFDLYWIAVDPAWQNRGLGRMLLGEVERRIHDAGGRHIYIETSGREQYAPTRRFYAACGYTIVASLPDFYDQGDDKLIWRKILPTPEQPPARGR